MSTSQLASAAEEISGLRGIFVTTMPDCLLFDAWIREEAWDPDEVASYFGDLVRANRKALKSLGSWSSDMQVTVESADALVVLTEISEHFVCACAFDRTAPLGMVRLHVRRILERVKGMLPTDLAEERARSVRIIDFLHRYAPDPHAVLMRVSVRTGLSMDKLSTPATLNDAETNLLEQAAQRVLGLETLHI